jgi:MFS family permease
MSGEEEKAAAKGRTVTRLTDPRALRAYTIGCLLFTAPLVLWPLARGSMSLILVMLFGSGFGVMVLDISIGAIFAAVIPDRLRSRVTGAFQAVNYGTRPLGALLGGLLGSSVGLRPALWVATLGGVTGFALLLPTPLPGYRLPAAPSGASRDARSGAGQT